MTTRNGKMFSIIITVIYFRCILCETTESSRQTEILSTGIINTTLVSTTYSTLETTNSSQQATSNIETTEYPTNTTATETTTQTNTSFAISNFSSMNLSIPSTEPSQDTNATSFVNTTPHSTTTVLSMTLEEKQTRNGLASAVICIGSLILIVIAYLSSFIDKPIEKVPKIDRKELQNSKYTFDNEGQIPNVKEETGRKISFGEVSQFSMKQTPDTTNDVQMTNVKETVTDDHNGNIKGTKIEGQPGVGVFAQNRKFFENNQPKRTVTN